ncbi:hypothetical protein ACOMHN_060462 [Nucella lapillus]
MLCPPLKLFFRFPTEGQVSVKVPTTLLQGQSFVPVKWRVRVSLTAAACGRTSGPKLVHLFYFFQRSPEIISEQKFRDGDFIRPQACYVLFKRGRIAVRLAASTRERQWPK